MLINNANLAFILTIVVIGWFYLQYPEGMDRLLYFISLQLSMVKINIMKTYMKWKLLRDLNKMNKEMGRPPIPWNHKKKKSPEG